MSESLAESDERGSLFHSIFEAVPDALLLVNGAGHIVRANPAASRLLGYALEELVALPVDALVPEAIRPRHQAYRDGYAHRPVSRPMGTQMELVARCKDGSEVMVEIALSPLRGEGQHYVVAAVRGVQDYPRVKQALQRARYSEAIARIGAMAVDLRDPERLLREVPAAAAQALLIDAAVVSLLDSGRQFFVAAAAVGFEAVGLPGYQVPNRPDTPAGYVLAQGGPVAVADYHAERRFVVPPAFLAAGFQCGVGVPLSDRGQTIGVLGVHARAPRQFGDDDVRFLQSLANLLASSLQRAATEAALSHAQRLETVGQLTGGIAHDFNNLLTVIQGNLQVLEDLPAISADPAAQQLLAAAARASRRGAELTSKLLAFSRRQVLSPSRVDSGALLRSLADMLQRTLDPRIRIDCVAAEKLYALVDAGQLESALLNLAINARDAMPDGGTLSFACRACTELPLELAVDAGSAHAAPGYIEVDVSDTGLGMSEAVREHAFEPFFTTKEAGRGTGLGLSAVYGFIKQSQGAVRLRTQLGVGTTVTLILPRHRRSEAAAAPSAEPGAALPAGLAVLLVEDEPEVRSVVRRQLLALGCVVTEMANAEQALAHLGAGLHHDLLLTDVALGGGLDGTALARQVHHRWPTMAVQLMSGYATELLQQRGAQPLATELLRKPFERDALAQALSRALARRNPAA